MTSEAYASRTPVSPRKFPSFVDLPAIKHADISTAKVGTHRVRDPHELWGLFWTQEESFAQHSARSADRIQRIGKALIGQEVAGTIVTQTLVNRAATAMLLHDIGKLGVNVQGEREFIPTERQAMDVHTIIGEQMLNEMGFPDYIVLAALWHHSVNTPEFRRAAEGMHPDTVAIIVLVTAVDIKDAMTDTSRGYIVAKTNGKTPEEIDLGIQDELRNKLGDFYTGNAVLQHALREYWSISQD